MHLEADVGTPGAPAPPDAVVPRADALFDRAAAQSGCATPVIALNEMQGVTAAPPLSANATQYRVNVLAFVQELVAPRRDAVPAARVEPERVRRRDRLVAAALDARRRSCARSTGRRRRSTAQGVNARQPAAARRPPHRGPEARRDRRPACARRADARLPVERRRRAAPGCSRLASWLEFVKLATLAAKQVAAELGVGSLWNWGWATLSAAGADATRRPPRASRSGRATRRSATRRRLAPFDTSLTEGQLSTLPPYAQCVIDGRVHARRASSTRRSSCSAAARPRYTALFGRLAATALVPVDRARRAAGGAARSSRSSAASSPRRSVSGVTPGFARGVIVDELRFAQLDLADPARRGAAPARRPRSAATTSCPTVGRRPALVEAAVPAR